MRYCYTTVRHQPRGVNCKLIAELPARRICTSVPRSRSYLLVHETGGSSDPRVLTRIRFAETLTQAQIDDAYAARAEIAARFDAEMDGFGALLAPTLLALPPTIAEVEADFDRLNAAMLRNTSLVNLADGCALAMPTPGLSPPWSMTMLVGRKGQDAGLLAVAKGLSAS